MTDVDTRRYYNKWEFWVHNLMFGLFQAPYYSFSQTVMAELTPPGFDFMVRAILQPLSPTPSLTCCGYAVFWLVWIDESYFIDCRTERDPGGHQQDRKYLAWLFIPVCHMPHGKPDHLVGRGRAQRPTRCRAMGSGAAWYSVC